jgi:Skp family chaperone for outer membrane proteins
VKLLKKIAEIAAEVGKREDYTLILDMSFIVYASKEADLTNKIIKAFDAAKE